MMTGIESHQRDERHLALTGLGLLVPPRHMSHYPLGYKKYMGALSPHTPGARSAVLNLVERLFKVSEVVAVTISTPQNGTQSEIEITKATDAGWDSVTDRVKAACEEFLTENPGAPIR